MGSPAPGCDEAGSVPVPDAGAGRAGRLVLEFLRRTHLARADEVATIAAEEAAAIGWSALVLHLVDLEQRRLVPLDSPAAAGLPVLDIARSPEGRSFARSEVLRLPQGAGVTRLISPLLDGVERLGALSFSAPSADLAEPASVELAERFAHLLAQTVVTKGLYSDVFELKRRSRPMRVASELARSLLPPRTYASRDLVIAGFLEPTYTAGGDSFDFAVNAERAHVAIFDAMGHGLAAAGHASFAVAAYRAARREGLSLEATYGEMDGAIARSGAERFVTAILAELDVSRGVLRLVSAGHPSPLLLRGGHVVALESAPNVPLGLGLAPRPPAVREEQLEPGDLVLLYTDGFPEARSASGEFFTLGRLVAVLERAAAGENAAEALRRLRHAVLDHQDGLLQDDATALVLGWRTGGAADLLPETV